MCLHSAGLKPSVIFVLPLRAVDTTPLTEIVEKIRGDVGLAVPERSARSCNLVCPTEWALSSQEFIRCLKSRIAAAAEGSDRTGSEGDHREGAEGGESDEDEGAASSPAHEGASASSGSSGGRGLARADTEVFKECKFHRFLAESEQQVSEEQEHALLEVLLEKVQMGAQRSRGDRDPLLPSASEQ